MGIAVRHLAQTIDHAIESGQHHLGTGRLELQSMAGVVDVLAGAGKVHKLLHMREFRTHRLRQGGGFELRLDPVLHSLDVVVGRFLNRLDGQRILRRESLHQAQQMLTGCEAQGGKFLQTHLAQRDKPGDFNLHAAVHVALLAHEGAQARQFAGIAAIKRRQGRHGG
jgi:hypothetical protein